MSDLEIDMHLQDVYLKVTKEDGKHKLSIAQPTGYSPLKKKQ